MSKKYNFYLSEKLITYFYQSKISPGKKYFAQFENQDTLDEFYKMLYEFARTKSLSEEFIYDLDSSYKTFIINIKGTKVLVAKENPDVTLDFLTRFRNCVGEGREYSDHALLLLICSKLDSIVEGTESLHREGLPFYYGAIIDDIKGKIDDVSNNLSEEDKEIIRYELNYREADKYVDKTSLELYRPILEIMDSGKIEKSEYKAFSMFYDSDLAHQKPDDIVKRIERNRFWFKEIEEAIRSKNVEQLLSVKLGNILLTKLERLEKEPLEDGWSDVFDFKTILKSIEDKKTSKNLDINKLSFSFLQGCYCSEDTDYFIFNDRKGVKNKKVSWLIFNRAHNNTLNVVIELTEKLKKNGIKFESEIRPDVDFNGAELKLRFNLLQNESFCRFALVNDETRCRIEINLCIINGTQNGFNTIIPKVDFIDAKRKLIALHNVEGDIKFNIDKPTSQKNDLQHGASYTFLEDSALTLSISNDIREMERVAFNLNIDNQTIKFLVEQSQGKSKKISGIKLYSEKLAGKQYVYDLQNKISFNRTEYRLDRKLKEALDLEHKIIKQGIVFGEINGNSIIKQEVNLPLKVKLVYDKILNYFSVNNTLPSLCPLKGEIIDLYREFISEINSVVESVPEGEPITNSEIKNIFIIGACTQKDRDEILLSPFHPVNIAHQLAVSSFKVGDNLDIEIAKKINSRFAYPYFYFTAEKLYKVVDNNESLIEWKNYISTKDNSKNGGRYYVSKLINDKIDLFVKHFNCMFEVINNDVLKINLINMGDCSEVFEGLINYYYERFNETELERTSKKIIVTIYNDSLVKTEFDILSNEYELKKFLLDNNKINFNNKKYNINELIAFIKDKLSFYEKLTSDEEYEYAHLSFYEMASSFVAGSNNQNRIDTGIMLEGVLSGLTSTFMGDSYRTSFGSKNIRTGEVEKLYRNMNVLALYSRRSDPFSRNACISTEVKNESNLILNKIYESSYWVTFIDPKVDLNFFINDVSGKPLTIIHYSDQYTATNGYDAITVTNKTKQYIDLISGHMRTNNMQLSELEANKIINSFNAVNGNWLLKLISSDKRYEKEKISLISAVKLSMAKFKSDNIIWVPLAMEEILRVTGAVKLNAKQGLLSAKNLEAGKGEKSDDLLMVGINIASTDHVKVYLHPIEVKIGENSYICMSKEKAKKQIESTKIKILDKSLSDDQDSDIVRQMRRNYLMQLVLIAAKKLKLYKIWESQKWDSILDGKIREKLLNEDYSISNELDQQIGIGTIIQFANVEDENNIAQCQEDDCTIIQSTTKYALKLLTKEIDEIVSENDFTKVLSLDEVIEENSAIVEKQEDLNNDTQLDILVPQEELNVTEENEPQSRGMKIIFGTKHNAEKLIWQPNDTNLIMHTNTGIIGTMGTGKTQFTKSLITQIYRESSNNIGGHPVGILIFDYKGDYNEQKEDFINATNAKVYKLFHLPYNPLSIIMGDSPKPMLPLHIANSFKETLSKAYGLGVKQETLLRELIMDAYAQKGINKINASTWTNNAPTFHDVYNLYMSRDDVKEDSLYAAMKAIEEFEIFEPDVSKTKSLYDLIDGVTVIDLSGYDAQIQNLIVAITLDLFYMQMQTKGHSYIDGNYRQLNKIVLVDEADNFLSQDFLSIKKIMKEGREFGVGTILSTQLLSHFSSDSGDFANYIFTWVVHNVADLSAKDVKKIFNTQTKTDEDRIYRDIKNLQKHQSLVKFTSVQNPEYITDLPFYKIIL